MYYRLPLPYYLLFLHQRNRRIPIQKFLSLPLTWRPVFLGSIGVNSAISKRGEDLEKTSEAIAYTGIRWIRTGYEGDIPMEDFLALHKSTGVKFSYGLLSGGTNIKRLIEGGRQLEQAGALLAFEGNNEPNNWGITYGGKKGGNNLSWLPVAELQRDLYAAVKNDAVVKKYPVWSISENGAQTDNTGLQFLTIPKGANTQMPEGTIYADYANCHNYIVHPSAPGLRNNQTWNAASPYKDCKVDGLYGNYGLTWSKKFPGYSETELAKLPKVTTETGTTIHDEITEEEQAVLLTNFFLAQYKRGWSYTAVYLLRDRSDEEGNQQFGFYKPDYTKRKAAIYLHNLTTILADTLLAAKPATLRYEIINQPVTVHDILLQKSNGKFELVIWDERVSGNDEVEINFGNKKKMIKMYDTTIGTDAVQTLQNENQVKLTLNNHAVIIEISE